MDPKPSLSDRRQFLKLAGLGSAGAAASVVATEADAAPRAEDRPDPADYRESDHVKTFYRLARF